MTSLKALAAAVGVAIGLMAVSEPASANPRHGYRHGPSVNFSFGYWGGPRYWGPGYWGAGYWGPGYWGPGWGYGGPPAVVYAPPQEPRVWVESDPAPATPAPAPSTNPNAPQWWYWCASSRGYYPYVSSCAEGWQRVTPQPSAR
jgi:hypothetical protein